MMYVCFFFYKQQQTAQHTQEEETLTATHDYLMPVCFRGLFVTYPR